jgi:DNA helicase II / ATP-dependent DNA helicase PcrA
VQYGRASVVHGDDDLCREILAGCDEEQAAAITSESHPLRIVAGAGSGKTRVLTRRIAWRIANGHATAGHVLAITFTRKAAGELRGRLAALRTPGVSASTFHGVAFAQLRQAALDADRRPPVVLDSKARLLRELVRDSSGGPKAAADRGLINGLASEIEWAKARVVQPRNYPGEARAAGRNPPIPISDFAALFEQYELMLKRKGLVDFEGMLAQLADLIQHDSAFAAAQRWRFRHLFVDEFQDVNAAQLRLLEAWLGSNTDVCVVGDPHQSIYAWNGSDPRIMTTLDQRWPQLVTVRLSTNYRSTPEVLAAAAGVLFQGADGGAGRASRPAGKMPVVRAYGSDEAEADGVAAELRMAHHPGRRWRQLAVLARTNAQLIAFQQACTRRDIPCRLAAGSVLDRPAVRKALAELGREGSSEALGRFVSDLEEMVTDGDDAKADNEGEGDGGGPSTEDVLDLAALAGAVREYLLLDQHASVSGFLAWLRAYWRDGSGSGADAVELTTFHRAKGLQWQAVFVTGLEAGLVPIGSAADRDAATEAEERRLLYVALTRAEDELHCSWARERRFGARTSRREPSPYLRAIESVANPKRAAPAAPTRVTRKLVPRVITPPEPGDPLVTALREWRAVTARAARVPAYVVMPDTTIEGIAAARPRTLRRLLQVPGIGPSRSALYGEKLLALVASHTPLD